MSTLDVVMDIANLGVQIASLKKLSDLNQHGITATEFQAFQNRIRNEIFKLNNAAKIFLG